MKDEGGGDVAKLIPKGWGVLLTDICDRGVAFAIEKWSRIF